MYILIHPFSFRHCYHTESHTKTRLFLQLLILCHSVTSSVIVFTCLCWTLLCYVYPCGYLIIPGTSVADTVLNCQSPHKLIHSYYYVPPFDIIFLIYLLYDFIRNDVNSFFPYICSFFK